jgi:hypothetical protein
MKLGAIVVSIVAAIAAACGGSTTSGTDCVPVPLHCAGACGATANPSCVNGQWVCPEVPNIACDVDASSLDASHDSASDARADGSDASLGDGGPFACGPMKVCDRTQYCEEASGGPPPPPDSGPNVGYSCTSFPQACAATPTCACLRANGVCGGGAVIDCKEMDGDVTVSCGFP